MAKLGLVEAFALHGATLKNPMYSVSAWTPNGELVVSLWAHHYRKGPGSTIEFTGSTDRWQGNGKEEFCENIRRAFDTKARVRLVIVSTLERGRVESGEDASKIKKDFDYRPEFVGQVSELNGDHYVFQFSKV